MKEDENNCSENCTKRITPIVQFVKCVLYHLQLTLLCVILSTVK